MSGTNDRLRLRSQFPYLRTTARGGSDGTFQQRYWRYRSLDKARLGWSYGAIARQLLPGGPNSHNYNRGMDTSRSVDRNIGWADSRILGRHTLHSPDTNQTRNPYRKQT
jgi:hypothetical protein